MVSHYCYSCRSISDDSAEYDMDGLKRDIQHAMLNLSCMLSLTAEKIDIYSHGLDGSYSHITRSESINGVIYKTIIVCANSSVMFPAS